MELDQLNSAAHRYLASKSLRDLERSIVPLLPHVASGREGDALARFVMHLDALILDVKAGAADEEELRGMLRQFVATPIPIEKDSVVLTTGATTTGEDLRTVSGGYTTTTGSGDSPQPVVRKSLAGASAS